MRLSFFTISFGIFIIVSASFMGQVLAFIIRIIGKSTLEIILWLVFFLVGLKMLVNLIKQKYSIIKIVTILFIFILGIYFALQLKIIAERIHILEYGLLGWLTIRDLTESKKKLIQPLIFSLIFIVSVGFIDEAFQKILPNRVGELRDILFNFLGSIWGLTLYLFKYKFR